VEVIAVPLIQFVAALLIVCGAAEFIREVMSGRGYLW